MRLKATRKWPIKSYWWGHFVTLTGVLGLLGKRGRLLTKHRQKEVVIDLKPEHFMTALLRQLALPFCSSFLEEMTSFSKEFLDMNTLLV